MLFPNIFGAYDTRDLPNLGVADVGEAAVNAAIRQWATRYNDVVTSYTGLLARETTQATGNFGSANVGGEMQPTTEWGEVQATHTQQAQWAWGAPIRAYRDRQIYTEQYLATKSLGQINTDTIAATNRDFTTRLKVIQRALFNPTTYVWTDGPFPGSDKGPITVYPLFNADGRSGSLITSTGAVLNVGTLQSYLPSGSATLVKAQFTLGRTKLRERNLLGRVIHIISNADADTVKAMAGFIPRTTQSPYVTVSNPGTTTEAVVQLPEAIGVFSDGGATDGEVVVFPFWPAGYTFHFDATQPKPVVVRLHELTAFQGFRLVQDETRAAYGDQSLRNKQWEEVRGAAVENQANGIVILATAGSYAAPTLALPLTP